MCETRFDSQGIILNGFKKTFLKKTLMERVTPSPCPSWKIPLQVSILFFGRLPLGWRTKSKWVGSFWWLSTWNNISCEGSLAQKQREREEENGGVLVWRRNIVECVFPEIRNCTILRIPDVFCQQKPGSGDRGICPHPRMCLQYNFPICFFCQSDSSWPYISNTIRKWKKIWDLRPNGQEVSLLNMLE